MKSNLPLRKTSIFFNKNTVQKNKAKNWASFDQGLKLIRWSWMSLIIKFTLDWEEIFYGRYKNSSVVIKRIKTSDNRDPKILRTWFYKHEND